MSVCLSSQQGVKARKPHHCALCGERIEVGALYDRRSGVSSGDMWTMHMHVECHAFEISPVKPVDEDWYEDVSDPAFSRAEALAYQTQASVPRGTGLTLETQP